MEKLKIMEPPCPECGQPYVPKKDRGRAEAGTNPRVIDESSEALVQTMLGELLAYEKHGKPQNLREWATDIVRAVRQAQGASDELFQELKRAQAIIDRLRAYRESLLTCHMGLEPSGRRRIRELSTPPRDDHDRAVLLLLDDYERWLALIAAPVPSQEGASDTGEQVRSAVIRASEPLTQEGVEDREEESSRA